MPNLNSCQLACTGAEVLRLYKGIRLAMCPRWWLRRNQGPRLAVGIGPALLQRRRVTYGLRVFHCGLEGFLEGIHFRLRADGDAGVRWPDGPDAPDEHIAGSHGIDYFLCGALGVEHETVRFGGNVGIVLAVEPLESFLADGGVQLLSFCNEM